MNTYLKLLSDLEHNLKALEKNITNFHCLSQQSITLCKGTLHQLKTHVQYAPFSTEADEIRFYKHIKPKVVSYLIFYVKRLDIESKRPRTGEKEQIRYLNKAINALQHYFNNNLEFYHYYKTASTHFDDRYFLQKNKTIRLNIEAFHFYSEESFSTSHDSTVATIMAYTELIDYFKTEIAILGTTNQHMETNGPFKKPSSLQWTGSKTDLVELIYGLDSIGAINNGNSGIKDLAMILEGTFNIELGNFYHIYAEIKSRKTERTKFLKRLKDGLDDRMDGSDA